MLLALRSLWEEQASSGVVTGTSAVTAAPGRSAADGLVEHQLVGGKKRKLPLRRSRRGKNRAMERGDEAGTPKAFGATAETGVDSFLRAIAAAMCNTYARFAKFKPGPVPMKSRSGFEL